MDASPMKLQSLAEKTICVWMVHEWAKGERPVIDVWRKDRHSNCKCSAHNWFLWQLYEMQVPRFAHIPSKIQYQIEDSMIPILETATTWIHTHCRAFNNIFHDKPSSPLNEYIVKLVWNHHFKIDNLATAKNILTNEKLSLLERFRFASVYCIVDEIEKFRDAIDSMPTKFDFNAEPFEAYWSKYLKSELHTISVPKNSSIELWLFKTSLKRAWWPAVVYFFDKLDSARKSGELESMLEMYYDDDDDHGTCVKELLVKLADKKWNLACPPSISKFVEELVRQRDGLKDVRYIWTTFGSKMDSKNFCDIIETLVLSSMRNASDFEKWTRLLMEIWTSSSSRLKQSAVDMRLWQSMGEKFFDYFGDKPVRDFRARRLISDPLTFVRKVLEIMPAEMRSEFFQRNFFWLIVWAPCAAVEELMREFLPHYDRDVFELKQQIANNDDGMQSSLCILLHYSEYDEIDAVLSFLNASRLLKFNFITSSRASHHMCLCVYCGDWKDLYKYLEENVAWPSGDMPKEIMKKVISSRSYWARKIGAGELNDLKEFASTMYDDHADNSQLKFLKKRFESRLFKVLFENEYADLRKKGPFDRTALRNFLLWIYDDDEKLIDENFKQPRLFPKGFLVQLEGCVVEGSFRATESMDEFLKWCFATEAERQQFKRGMIYDCRQHRSIEGLLVRRKYRRTTLFWFFDEDTSLIEKFTADCARDPMISRYIRDTDSGSSSDSSPSNSDSERIGF